MKANELMIGDWVAQPVNDEPCKVVSLMSDIELDDGGFYEEVEPIPLTTEILEKNFPTIEDGVAWEETEEGDLFFIRVEYDKHIKGIFNDVHELQHALRLAGIDKEINL